MEGIKKYILPILLVILIVASFAIISYKKDSYNSYDESNDWCKNKCEENGLSKIKYSSNGLKFFCDCIDVSTKKTYRANVFGN